MNIARFAWKNNLTRTFIVIIPTYILLLIPALLWAGIDTGLIRSVCCGLYAMIWTLVLINGNDGPVGLGGNSSDHFRRI